MNEAWTLRHGFALLVVMVVCGAMPLVAPVAGDNDGSRWDTVWSLSEGQGYVIDAAPYRTVDKVKRGEHFYSSKPPLLPTMLASVSWLIKDTTGATIPAHARQVIGVSLLLLNVVPLALMVALYGRLLERGGYRPATRWFCLCAAALGTYLTVYSVTLNNHTVAAWAAFFALYAYLRIRYDGRTEGRYFLLCGAFAAWTVVNEMLAVVFALALMGSLLHRDPARTLRFFLPPALVLGIAYLYTTYLATGGLVPTYVRFGTELYQYAGSYWRHPVGIDAAHEPKWIYTLNLTLGHHGVFSLSPIFAIAVYGAFVDDRWKAVHRLGLMLSVALLAFYVCRTNNYGGVCQGPRWLFWLIPFWLLGLAPAVERHVTSRTFRALACACLLVSVFSVGFALVGHRAGDRSGPWSVSWLHQVMRTTGLVGY